MKYPGEDITCIKKIKTHVVYKPRDRQVFIKLNTEYPDKINRYMKVLQFEYGYSIQLEMF